MTRPQLLAIVGAILLVGIVIATTLIVIDVQRRHDDCLQRYDYPRSEIMCK